MFLAYLGCFFCGLAVKNSILLILHFYLMGRYRIWLVKTRQDIGTRQERSFKTIQDWETQLKTSQDFKPLWNLDSRHDKTRLSKFGDGMRQHFPSRLGIRDRKFLHPPLSPWSAMIHFKNFVKSITFIACFIYWKDNIYGKHYDKNDISNFNRPRPITSSFHIKI